MFLHYFAAGITLPIMSLYLSQELGFGGTGAGIILSLSAVSAVFAPLVGSFITDRLLSAERVFAVAEFGAGVFIFLLWISESFIAVLVWYLLYMSMLVPAMALSNTIVFHHSTDGGRSFGGIRLWGTVGWVVAGWGFSVLWIGVGGGVVTDAPLFSALVAAGLGVFALTLPRGEGGRPRRRELIPRGALRVMMRPEVALVAAVALLMQISHRMYYFGAAPYIRHVGFPDRWILPALSVGQFTEILSMLLLPLLFRRFTYRTVLGLGVLMEFCRFSAFYFGASSGSAILAIAFHGPAFTLFFIVAFIYLNTFADGESRAGVQQLFLLLIEGAAALSGSLLAGSLYDAFAVGGRVDYTRFWSVPLGISIISLVLILLLNVIARGQDRRARRDT